MAITPRERHGPGRRRPRGPRAAAGRWCGLDALEPRVLLSADVAAPAGTDDGASTAGTPAVPLLPDLWPWADQGRRYLYGPSIDRTTFPGSFLLRFTTASTNIGAGPLELRADPVAPDGTRQVYQRVHDSAGVVTEQLIGVSDFDDNHWFFQVDPYARYRLRAVTPGDGVGDVVAEGIKASFCLLDSTSHDLSLPGAPSARRYLNCQNVQGISVGWADIYSRHLEGQWIDITGVPNGTYWLEAELDPENKFQEADETNNVTRIQVDVFVPGEIHGIKFEDLNGDGQYQPEQNETPLANWTIFLDENGDGLRDAGELSTSTDADGAYRFTNLDAGTHHVGEVVPDGWHQVEPARQVEAVTTVRVASGLNRPVFAVAAPGDDTRLFIGEQHTGRIRILDLGTGTLHATPFLDLDGLAGGNEQGLLGMAFHPDFATNGTFYVNLTAANGRTEVRRYQASAANANTADPASARAVISYAQPQSNHNGGWLDFGPDGRLYIGSGDGGNRHDLGTGHTVSSGNAQDITDNLLGKILRLDVDGDDFPADAARNYAIPTDNPFVGVTGDDEIWSYGLRNPWRASFDRVTGDLYIGDVGQWHREEIDFQPADSPGGANYGWRLREGSIATPDFGVGGPPPAGAIEPIYDYAHDGGSTEGGFAVAGGYVYRGPIAGLHGHYFFADNVTERIWSFTYDGASVAGFTDWTTALAPDAGTIDDISSFGEDAVGNLYIVDLGGEVFRLEQNGRPGTRTVVLETGDIATDIDLANRRIFDFGDAPDDGAAPGYPTLLAHDGARHVRVPGGPALGAAPDVEFDGQPRADALGDDRDGFDDEHGVHLLDEVVAGATVRVRVTVAGAAGLLSAWVDFDASGDWSGDDEQVFADAALAPGEHELSFDVPAGATTGPTFARFRLSSEIGLGDGGAARDGEVEDMALTIVPETTGPRVSEVVARGSGWTGPFLDHLGAGGLGDDGYRLSSGAGQLDPLSWSGVDQIRIVFDEPVLVASGDLSITTQEGVAPAVVGFVYDTENSSATWTFAQALVTDRFRLHLPDSVLDAAGNALDGEWVDGTSSISGDGAPGADFDFRFDVAVADLNADGVVSVRDIGDLRAGIGLTTADEGYDARHDLDASGAVDGADAAEVRSRMGSALPAAAPGMAATAATGASARRARLAAAWQPWRRSVKLEAPRTDVLDLAADGILARRAGRRFGVGGW